MDLKRSKSLENIELPRLIMGHDENEQFFYFLDHRSQSESSLEPCVIINNRSDRSSLVEDQLDSSMEVTDLDGKVSKMESKIDELNKMLHEQHHLLLTLREDLSNYKSENYDLITLKNKMAHEMTDTKIYFQSLEQMVKLFDISDEQPNDRAKTLLDAIELKQSQRIDFQIKDSINKFLQSDELKTHLASATVDSLRNVIKNCFSETFSKAYLPILENSYRRLFRLVTKILQSAFRELEANSSYLYKSAHNTSKSLRIAIEKHQNLLESTKASPSVIQNVHVVLEEVLQNELMEWREKLFKVLMCEMNPGSGACVEDFIDEDPPNTPPSPPQPADPQQPIIEQLVSLERFNYKMKSAEIKKHIRDGNINKSFEEALSSLDLSLVMAACRAADPATIFAEPCLLHQSVLLSLVQQLVTDMVHDTQLKCRYLEDAIIKLNVADPATRAHLPLVVQEVRKHLSRFLRSYPSHVASRRITLIVMAASNLIK